MAFGSTRPTWQRLPTVPENTNIQPPHSFQDARNRLRSRSIQSAAYVSSFAEKYSVRMLSIGARTGTDLRNHQIDEITRKTSAEMNSVVEDMSDWSKVFMSQAGRALNLNHERMEQLFNDYKAALKVIGQVLSDVFKYLKRIMRALRDGLIAIAKAAKEFIAKVKELVTRAVSNIHDLFEKRDGGPVVLY